MDTKTELQYLKKQRAVMLRIIQKQNRIIKRMVKARPDDILSAKMLVDTMDVETELEAVMLLTDTKAKRYFGRWETGK